MFNIIKKFFLFLLPILKTAVAQAAADELAKVAYPSTSRRRYPSYDRLKPVRDYASYDAGLTRNLFKDLDRLEHPAEDLEERYSDDGFHDVLMVAFDLKGKCPKAVHEWLHDQMPTSGEFLDRQGGDVVLDAWWVANDERFDGSDCDSAVFVSMGNQDAARGLLRERGLTN